MATPTAGDSENITFESSVLEVEHQFSMMLAAARRSVKHAAAAVHPALQPLGFTVLMTLYRGGECQQGSVVETLHVDKALLSRTVSQLEALGLVVRRTDPADGRVQLLDLTAEGRARFEGANTTKRSKLRARLRSWTPAELRNLSDLLHKLNERD
ncbi:MarR family winged helix-turn-helix transcriptional regulator [Arthrobacter zhaoxinii]|uniref:MarR family winged helix-turn-helix transcriptional regulator n=1 Tax=Arthrobacter zhaoxinii TaxID=2964616 RepID=UPI0021065CCE|nr:MarR family transcriptional regulator [Arthrobacter zhaoxinii]MCQ1999993.1 MarR family transcriptional regulator [Arthrobacter zhaoxinii]